MRRGGGFSLVAEGGGIAFARFPLLSSALLKACFVWQYAALINQQARIAQAMSGLRRPNKEQGLVGPRLRDHSEKAV